MSIAVFHRDEIYKIFDKLTIAMEKDWIFFADHILKKVAEEYPFGPCTNEIVSAPEMKRSYDLDMSDEDKKEFAQSLVTFRLFCEASGFLEANGFIEYVGKDKDFIKCTIKGLELAKKGLRNHLEEIEQRAKNEKEKYDVEIKLLKRQLVELERKNKTYHTRTFAAVVIAITSLVLTILQILSIWG